MECNSCKKAEDQEKEKEKGCCACLSIRLCTYKCWQFVVATFFSVIAFVIAIWGLMGGFVQQDNTFYSNLVTFVLGVWLPSPSMKPDKKRNKTSENKTDSADISVITEDGQDETSETGKGFTEGVFRRPVENK